MKKNFGMWIFLATEVLIFGPLITLYQIFFYEYQEPFKKAAKELHFMHGTVNTVLLLTSSYFVALALHKRQRKWIGVAIFMGILFLGIKAHEYYDLTVHGKFPLNFFGIPQEEKLFISFYAYLTFLHAIHVFLGIFALSIVMFWWERKNEELGEGVGLYWHFVDMVWVFLYPLFYLIGH